MAASFNHGYALLIGVGESAYPRLSLPVTVRDVQALQAVLLDPDLCAYPDNAQHVRVLQNQGATKQAILDGLEWLKEQAASDPEPNFGFSLDDDVYANSATLGTFLTESTSLGFPQGQKAKEFETFSSSRWRAAQTKDVPESSTVLSLALLGLCFLGKKKLSRAA